MNLSNPFGVLLFIHSSFNFFSAACQLTSTWTTFQTSYSGLASSNKSTTFLPSYTFLSPANTTIKQSTTTKNYGSFSSSNSFLNTFLLLPKLRIGQINIKMIGSNALRVAIYWRTIGEEEMQ